MGIAKPLCLEQWVQDVENQAPQLR
jgi:hypothetical protein